MMGASRGWRQRHIGRTASTATGSRPDDGWNGRIAADVAQLGAMAVRAARQARFRRDANDLRRILTLQSHLGANVVAIVGPLQPVETLGMRGVVALVRLPLLVQE